MEGTLVKRSSKVAFYGVPEGTSGEGGSGTTVTYYRMTGFTDMSTSKNAKEYSRQYIDEDFEQSDVIGYSPSISYGFDRYKNNVVHDDITRISDDELTGSDAVRPIIIVDTTVASGVNAIKRDFAVIPDSEGDGTDTYAYSGNFKVKGAKVKGTATISEDGETLTFVESTVNP